MSRSTQPPAEERGLLAAVGAPTDRRTFLRRSGAAALLLGATGSLAACDDDGTGGRPRGVTLDFSTDVGVLNYAYALEQLEAAFYTQVVAGLYAGASADEQAVLTDLRDHEIAHREFFAAALGADAIPDLTPDFSSVDFDDRASVLAAAQAFEDLGVGAYNGAAGYISTPAYLVQAGKIVSVEARHASVIRTLAGASFAPDAFDDALTPTQVVSAAGPFVQNPITLLNS